MLTIRPKSQCRWDELSLGEVMLRFDPGDHRIATTRHFEVFEGGGEYNVARGLKRCFNLETAHVTALADNPVGRLVEDLMYQGGVHQIVRWIPDDGVGRAVRNGLNFVERGFGVRAALGCSDRGQTAISQMKPADVDWEEIFGKHGARWFHCGGIFCALSEGTPAVAMAAMNAARKHGTIVSYDLNYRPSLWKSIGGKQRAQEVNRSLAPLFEVKGMDEHISQIEVEAFKGMIKEVVKEFPFQVVATTLRKAKTATVNDWGAICYADGNFYEAKNRQNLEIYDRVGGGDSFASGLVYGFLAGQGPQWAVECGAAHGALAMTTPGDTTMATLNEVLQLMKGAGARIAR